MPEEDNGTTPEQPARRSLQEIARLRREEQQTDEQPVSPPSEPAPAQPQAPQPQPNLQMQLSPQGVVLSFPVTVNLAVDNETMEQLVRTYLQARPDFQHKLVMELVAVKQQELAIIQMVNKSRND